MNQSIAFFPLPKKSASAPASTQSAQPQVKEATPSEVNGARITDREPFCVGESILAGENGRAGANGRSGGNGHGAKGRERTNKDPEACVFVANMGHRQSDSELSQILRALFEPFGRITNVKTIRDVPNRPCAFVQFFRKEDAYRAIAGNQGATVGGRAIRLERARVNKTLLVSLPKRVAQTKIKDAQIAALENDPSRSICYFKTREEAIKCLSDLKQERLHVEFASKELQRRAGFGEAENGVDLTSTPLPKRLPQQLRDVAIIVFNIAPEFSKHDRIRIHFSQFAQVQSVHVYQRGDRTGEALVIFANQQGVYRAMSDSGVSTWCGTPLHIVPCSPSSWVPMVSMLRSANLEMSMPMTFYPLVYPMAYPSPVLVPYPGYPPGMSPIGQAAIPGHYPGFLPGMSPIGQAAIPGTYPECPTELGSIQPTSQSIIQTGIHPLSVPTPSVRHSDPPQQVSTPSTGIISQPRKPTQVALPRAELALNHAIAKNLRFTPKPQPIIESPFPGVGGLASHQDQEYFSTKDKNALPKK
jgi:hypothetical protein